MASLLSRASVWRAVGRGLAAAAVVLLACGAVLAQGRPAFVPDELLVAFHAGVSPVDAEAVYRSHGAAKIEILRATGIHRVRVAPSALDATERALARRKGVKFVERNKLHAPDFQPNDPSYGKQYHLPKIFAPLAWDITQGSSDIVVAILDSGVDPKHPDLAPKLVPGYNFYDNNADTHDVYGHGTAVAGAAAAIGNNALGVASPALLNRIMPIRVTNTSGYGSTSAIANGLTWAVDNGARVMNLSFGGIAASSTITAASQYVISKGGLVVGAAGNCGCTDSTPDNPYIISVSATDEYDNLASFSSRGPYVDVAAPGNNILTTYNGGGYGNAIGTSFSSPIVAGVVALMVSANPTLTPKDIEALLKANADDLGGAGWDPNFGYGRVNASRAVAAARGSVAAADTTPPTVSVSGPAPGSTVKGTVAVTVAAADAGGVARVDLYVDGTLHGSDATAPYAFAWDTSAIANGAHILTARATDGAGNAATSDPVSVNVENFSDTSPPSVTIVSVGLSGSKLNVSVSAMDNVAVTRVDLYVDGALVGSDTSAPWGFSLSLPRFSSGSHTVQARAYDAAGNSSMSGPATFITSASGATSTPKKK